MASEWEALAKRVADYLATRKTPWPDTTAMPQAVHEATRLLFFDARDETIRVLADIVDREQYGTIGPDTDTPIT